MDDVGSTSVNMTAVLMLTILLPLLAGVALLILERSYGERSAKVGVAAIVAAFAASLWVLATVSGEGPIRIAFGAATPERWFQVSLYVDRLSGVMMVLITAVSSVIHLYSLRYMQGERGYGRFFALLGAMSAVLLAMVSSGNLAMLFVCWQLVSWLLYLLLAYRYDYSPAYRAAFKTFIVHRVGDLAFLAGMVLSYQVYGTLDIVLLGARAAELPAAALTVGSAGGPAISAVTLITLLLFIGAMAKSAQFPLHVWLPDTMDTPTPVSALMHAGIVNAGGFLLNRLAPLYGQAPETLHVVFLVGGVTVLLGATMMLTQPDIKKTLGFSTMGQMGYMIMECGLGAFALAIFHLIAHGIFKATSFLYAGHVIHEARRDPKFPTVQVEDVEISRIPWLTGLAVTLVLPLIILLATHGLLHIPLLEEQGAVIFLFFAWVTSSQALLSLYRLKAVSSSKIATVMVLALSLVAVTYLWAAEAFTFYLYPAPGEAAYYFQAAAFPFFDAFVIVLTLLIIAGWVVVYTNIQGQQVLMPAWVLRLMPTVYVWFWNRLYIDALYSRIGQDVLRVVRRVDARLPGWLP